MLEAAQHSFSPKSFLILVFINKDLRGTNKNVPKLTGVLFLAKSGLSLASSVGGCSKFTMELHDES